MICLAHWVSKVPGRDRGGVCVSGAHMGHTEPAQPPMSHFIDEETEVQRLRNFLKVIQIGDAKS